MIDLRPLQRAFRLLWKNIIFFDQSSIDKLISIDGSLRNFLNNRIGDISNQSVIDKLSKEESLKALQLASMSIRHCIFNKLPLINDQILEISIDLWNKMNIWDMKNDSSRKTT
jgi:hypothetical protein